MSDPPSRDRNEPGVAGAGAPGPAPVTALSHVAIAVREADPLVQVLVSALGAKRGEEELLDGGTLRVVFVHLGPVTLELLEPRAPEHAVARFLDRRGPGLHHVSLEVRDLAAQLERARAAGLPLIDEAPRPGAHGTQVAFLHPKGLGGVLVELCQAKLREVP
jgi:methylmalonyl-CoA epimerase